LEKWHDYLLFDHKNSLAATPTALLRWILGVSFDFDMNVLSIFDSSDLN